MSLLLVVVGAAVGAPLRYLVGRVVGGRHRSRWPWGTVVVNVAGSLVLGVLVGASVDSSVRLLLGTGFCGGFTTYSAFSVETVRLGEEGAPGLAALTVVVEVGAGLLAAAAGFVAGRAL